MPRRALCMPCTAERAYTLPTRALNPRCRRQMWFTWLCCQKVLLPRKARRHPGLLGAVLADRPTALHQVPLCGRLPMVRVGDASPLAVENYLMDATPSNARGVTCKRGRAHAVSLSAGTSDTARFHCLEAQRWNGTTRENGCRARPDEVLAYPIQCAPTVPRCGDIRDVMPTDAAQRHISRSPSSAPLFFAPTHSAMLDILKTQKPYVVQGAAQGAYPRLEVEELMKNEYQWSLFMQAMRSLQQKGYKPKPASWQEIGGIHGLPYTRWSGDPAGPAQPDDTNIPDSDSPGKTKTQWQGYCYHSSVLFPPWHRVYMLLVEQAVTVEAKAIADKLVKDKNMAAKEREDWQDAACKLRFPYWDWSAVEAKDHGLPQIFMDATTTVRGPINTKLTLDPNPISRFDLNEIPKGAFDSTDVGVYFTKWKRTYRWAKPASGAGATGEGFKEDYDELRKALLQGLSPQEQPPIPRPFIPISSMCDKLRRMFSFPLTDDKKMFAIYWDRFAGTAPQSYNDAPQAEQDVINSYVALEDPHNSIHLDVGGSGDMGYDEMASFDPIFFFHHCNVDRQQALWEYCYPDYWLGDGYYDIVTGKGPTPFYDRDGAYQTVPRQPTLTEKTTLAPFRKNKTKYWDCTDVRGVQSVLKTYTYEPMHIKVKDTTVTIDISKPASLAQRKSYIAALQSYFADVSTPAANPQTKLAMPGLFHPPPTAPLPIPGTHKAVHGYRDFVVTAALQQFAFAGSHRLEMFVDGQFVAELSVFSRLNPDKCANCATRIAAGNAVVRGALGIPHAAVVHVLEKEGLNKKGTSEEGVVGALKKHLSARIVAPNGTVLALHVALAAFTSPPTSPVSTPLASPTTPSPLAGGPGGDVLKREHCPVLTLVSSGVALSAGDVLEPREAFDWRHHGAAVDGVWCHAQK